MDFHSPRVLCSAGPKGKVPHERCICCCVLVVHDGLSVRDSVQGLIRSANFRVEAFAGDNAVRKGLV